MNRKAELDIIRFGTTNSKFYYGASIEMPQILIESGEYIKHTEVIVPLGHSRYGGPIVDLPENVEFPPDLHFVAQLDLQVFSQFDKLGLLPRTGQLIFFADIRRDIGKVIYADISNNKLHRRIRVHEEDFFSGKLIDQVYADTESFSERFVSEIPNDVKTWDDFAGSEKSKLFGIFTHCQYTEKEIEDITFSDHLLLLQVGENGFNDEGVFSVLIPKDDLGNKVFDNCKFYWGQS